MNVCVCAASCHLYLLHCDGRVDLDSLKRMLDYLFDSIDGVLIGGSTGEAASLSTEEREDVIRAVATHLRGEKALVVSVADNSLVNSHRLSDVAGECSADLLVLSCPNYFELDHEMLQAYFGAVAQFASADICLYDNPVASKIALSVQDVINLLDVSVRMTHIEVTDTALGKVAAIHSASEAVTILAGEDSVLWHQLVGGAEGTMTVIAMIYPTTSRRMWAEFSAGRFDNAYEIYKRLTHFIHCAINAQDYPAVVKTVLYDEGVLASPEVRLPLLSLSKERMAEVFAAYRSLDDAKSAG